MNWILLSMLSAFFFSFRYVVIKKFLHQADTLFMAFAYRFFGALYLLPLLFIYEIPALTDLVFWKVVIFTSVLTALASILQLKAIQKYDLSSSVPFMSFIPLFMIFTVYFVYKELPGKIAIPGIVLLATGAVIINYQKKQTFKKYLKNIVSNRGALLFFGVALIFGITTTFDRKAIEITNGFTYTFIWHIVSILLFSSIFLQRKKNNYYIQQMKSHFKAFMLQGLMGIMAFLCQMIAVEKAREIEANVIYIKAITLLYILISVLFGIWIFKEKSLFPRFIGSAIMLAGALIIILSAS